MSVDNVKAMFRRGLALYHLHDHEAAMYSLQKAQRLSSPPDPAIKKYISLCQRAMQDYDKKQKLKYRGMFDKHPEPV
ncbi:PREDICTED: tetratricopeptide repeat protein 9C-like [Priapulus caudatus]|uniref:Tetratricopeptide repeat protein 9C-like n=1 Tax=Priapulus caudatus TaxID=37621 RepID=A0ABM1EC73_PRICU|nr:PREDICTED: tetratricopeptide repeat protein 9C-like [Priapulus caudatus]